MPNNLRETIRQAAMAIGGADILGIVDEVEERDLPALAKRLTQRGGDALEKIGAALSDIGHKTEGARAMAEGRFYKR